MSNFNLSREPCLLIEAKRARRVGSPDVWMWPILLKVESRSFSKIRLDGSENFGLI